MTEGPREAIRKYLLECLDETFESHHGIYIEKGRSLFETLTALSAEEASARACEASGSPAAHVRHTILYMNVLRAHMRGQGPESVPWDEIWEQDRPVSSAEWADLLAEFRREYDTLLHYLNDDSVWEKNETMSGALAILVHSAYHLGSIRHALLVIRHRGSGASAGIGRQPKP